MEYHSLGRAIAAIYRIGQAFLRAKLKELGVDVRHADTLYAIVKNEGLTLRELSDTLMVNKSATAQSVNNLSSLGFVRKEHDPLDGRAFHLYLAAKRKKVASLLDEAFSEMVQLHKEPLTNGEQDQLETLLTKLMKSLGGDRI